MKKITSIQEQKSPLKKCHSAQHPTLGNLIGLAPLPHSTLPNPTPIAPHPPLSEPLLCGVMWPVPVGVAEEEEDPVGLRLALPLTLLLSVPRGVALWEPVKLAVPVGDIPSHGSASNDMAWVSSGSEVQCAMGKGERTEKKVRCRPAAVWPSKGCRQQSIPTLSNVFYPQNGQQKSS